MIRFRCAIVFAAIAVCGVAASAADLPLTRFSNETDVILRLKAPKATLNKLATMVDKVQPGFGVVVNASAAAQLGAAISNPQLTGVDTNKDWYIAVLGRGTDEPAVVFAIPTVDAEAAQKSLVDGVHSKISDKWLFYSEQEDALPPDSAPSQTLASVMRGEPSSVFERGDISIFINAAHLKQSYKEQIDEAQEQVDTTLDQIGAAIPSQPGFDLGAVMKVYNQMARGVFQAVEDSEQLTIVANFADDGLTIENLASFTPGSETSAVLADQPRSDMKTASKLPADSLVIFGASGNAEQVMEWSMSMAVQMFKDNPQMADSLKQFQSAAKEVKFGGLVGSFAMFAADEEGVMRSVNIMEVDPAWKIREAAHKTAETTNLVEGPGFKQETTLDVDAEKFGERTADVVTVKQEFDDSLDPTGMQKQMQHLMFGDKGIQTRTVYEKDRLIQTMGGGKEQMAQVLKALDDSANVQPPTFRKGLIPNPNLLFLIDIPGFVVQGAKLASRMPGIQLPIDARMFDRIKLEKSYVGFSAAMEENAIRTKTRIPTQQAKSLVDLFAGLQGGGR